MADVQEIIKNLDKKSEKVLLSELKLSKRQVKKIVKRKDEKKDKFVKKSEYTIYKPNKYGEIANKYVKDWSLKLIKTHPKFFGPLIEHFHKVNIDVLSITYISMMIFYTIVGFPALIILFTLLNISFKLNILVIIAIVFISTVALFFGFYFYPGSLISGRARKIKNELPFALVHMSAISGSGANPISIFELLADSSEYPELRREIKKVLNYVNLFGYNLTNSLKAVSATTPSKELSELLEGMISTIESGGDLKSYVNEKANDSLNTYRLERKKKIEALATFSEVYTAVLIAAPLLLVVTLAIINTVGANLGGMDIKTIAAIGIYGFMPLLNIGFMVFLKVSQPDS